MLASKIKEIRNGRVIVKDSKVEDALVPVRQNMSSKEVEYKVNGQWKPIEGKAKVAYENEQIKYDRAEGGYHYYTCEARDSKTQDEREPDQSDIQAAQRGNNMLGMSIADLKELILLMEGKNTFASKVTLAAAKQMIAAKKRAGASDSKTKDTTTKTINVNGSEVKVAVDTSPRWGMIYRIWAISNIPDSMFNKSDGWDSESKLIEEVKKLQKQMYGDSKTKDEKIFSISTPQWEGDIRIIDNTHFEMKAKGSDKWTWALHIAQADDYILNALKAKGALKDNGRFFN